jgi:diguanylate cyclase (GGDEF)-like protein
MTHKPIGTTSALAAPPTERLTVLVVDDEEPIVNALERDLQQTYDVLQARTSTEALELLDARDVAIVLCDQVLSGSPLQGDELLEAVQERKPGTVSVMISGHCEPEDLIRAVNLGHIYAYIAKPWDYTELHYTLAKAAVVYRLRSDNARLLAELQDVNDKLAERVRDAVAELSRKNEMLEELTQSLEEKNRMLGELAVTDELTGVYNRRYLRLRLEAELERYARYGGHLACILLDLDDFKAVNDTHGHLVGDLVLRDVADVLRHVARRTDVVGRFGGEEFLVLCPSTNIEGAVVLAERIRLGIAELEILFGDGRSLSVTASAGVAATPLSAPPPDSFLGDADAALYKAKREGKNRIALARSGG